MGRQRTRYLIACEYIPGDCFGSLDLDILLTLMVDGLITFSSIFQSPFRDRRNNLKGISIQEQDIYNLPHLLL